MAVGIVFFRGLSQAQDVAVKCWDGSTTLVTGGAGFVGTNVVRALLRAGADVHCVVRPTTDLWRLQDVLGQLTVHEHDLCDIALGPVVRELCPQVIFHLAADGGHPDRRSERLTATRSTVLGTANLLEALRSVPQAVLVHAGSMTEYGARDRPVRETDTLHPSIFRGALKASSSLLVEQLSREAARQAVTVRLPAVYGPWEQADRFIPSVAMALLRDRKLALTPARITRDYTFVEDVVAGLLTAGERAVAMELPDWSNVINLGTGGQTSNHRVVEVMEQLAGSSLRRASDAYAATAVDAALPAIDITRAGTVLGWRPRYSLHAGLEETWSWFGRHAHRYP